MAWSTVAKRGAKKKAAKKQNAAPAAAPALAQQKAKRPKPPRLRPPRTAAIVMTLQPGAREREVTHASLLKTCREAIDLRELDIWALVPRQAKTGAFMLEVPGDDCNRKADALVDRMRQVLKDEDVRLHRPEKRSELRITGLDESITSEEVTAAVIRDAKCSPEQIKVGAIRRSRDGMGTVWVSVPVGAAKALVKQGRLLVGWVAARVVLLPQRPMRCYRCLELGHMSAKCQTVEDRSGLCYRCGEPGHLAALCSASPKCALCATVGKPTEHRLGSVLCTSGLAVPRRGGAASSGHKVRKQLRRQRKPPDKPRETETVMETQ